jgi:hypothetical protein
MARPGLSSFLKTHMSLLVILSIGLIFRFLFIEFQGLSNDELSAWYRTRYLDWDSFWNQGVKLGDMHPVFYQAFLSFWFRIFGDSEWAIRSTGLLFYVVNSLLVYSISNRFFSKNTGLALLSLYAGLSFTIINTTLARPYNSGTCFLLLTFWSILELNRSKNRFSRWHLGIIVGLAGSMLSHYFAFLAAAIVGFLGLIYLSSKKKIDLVLCSLIAILCFLPHWPVTYYQLNVGGLGWLPPPTPAWLLDFFSSFFNDSLALASLILLSILALLPWTDSISKTREQKFALAIFIATYLVGHLLSLVYTPIMRDLVMLFILPFLFLPLFRRFGNVKNSKLFLFALLIPLLSGFHSVFFGNILQPKHFGVFREIGNKISAYQADSTQKKYEFASNFNNVEYLNYYLKRPLSEPITDWSHPETVYQLADRAKHSACECFIYSWSNSFHLPMYYEVIQKYFPCTVEAKTYFNSAFRNYGKKGTRKLKEIKGLFPKKPSRKITSSEEFIGEIRFPIEKMQPLIKEKGYILAEACGTLSSSSPLNFVVTLERDGTILLAGKNPVLYQAFDQSKLHEPGRNTNFFLAFDLPKKTQKTDQIKIYFWNPERQTIEMGPVRFYFVRAC